MRLQHATWNLRRTHPRIDGRSPLPVSSKPRLTAFLCALVAILALGGSARAATITVTSSANSGPGTLRQAVLDADPGDLIVFDGDYTISLSTELPDIDFELTIDGEANIVRLDGGSSLRSGFELRNGADLTARNLEFRNGRSTFQSGGAIDAGGAPLPENGAFKIRLTIEGCTFRFNATESTLASGGAIYAASAHVTVRDSSFYNNSTAGTSADGGAIYSAHGHLEVERSWFSDNSAANGGAIYSQSFSPYSLAEITSSTFYGNSARVDGGAILTDIGEDTSIVVRDSLFKWNTSVRNGGAIRLFRGAFESLAHIENSTFFDNHSGYLGGGLYVTRTALDHVSVVGNTAAFGAGGILVTGFSRVRNSIVAGNGQDDDGLGVQSGPDDDCAASGSSFEHTLVETVASASALRTCVLPASAGNLVGVDPQFGSASPADNGGDTETLALAAGSPAIGAGNPATCRATDQRGYARTGGGCDLGAFETGTTARCVVWDGTTERSSLTAEALHLALAANAGVDLKIAGNCLGTTNVGDVIGGAGDEIVAAYVDQSIALEGGHRAFDWTLPPDGQANPTVIDALGTGRVVLAAPNETVTLRHLVLRNGVADVGMTSIEGRGGGIYAGAWSDLTLEQVTVRDSVANRGGGIFAEGAMLSISTSTVRDNFAANRGGGLYSSSTDATIDGSTFHGNRGENGGGGITVTDDLDITNSTVSGNNGFRGAGLQIESTAIVTANQITVANNRATSTAVEIGLSVKGELTLDNSIVSDSVGGSDCDVLSGGSANLSYSLIEDGSCGITPGVDGNATGDPDLDVLAPNPGKYRELLPPTWNHEIAAGSPAEDMASNSSCEIVDQRGYPRDDGLCDMGAFEIEAEPIAPNVTVSGDVSTAEGDTGLLEMTLDVTRTSSEQASFLGLFLEFSTATEGDDYYAAGWFYIPPGVTSTSIPLLVVGDTDIENDETVKFIMSTPSSANAVTAGFPVTATIVDDDNCPASLDLVGVTLDDDLDYSSPGPITATDVTVDAVVGFVSGASIALAEGFSVASGREFSAVLDPNVCP